MGRRLVQDQDGRIGEQRPGDGEPLPLSARKAAAVLADQRVEAIGKARDPRVETGPYEDGVELRLRGLGAREEQVRTDRRVEDVRVLARQREYRAHVGLPQVARVASVDLDPPLLGIEEAQQEVGDGRRAGSSARSSPRPSSRRSPRISRHAIGRW